MLYDQGQMTYPSGTEVRSLSHTPHVRYAALTRYIELCQEFDLDAAALMRSNGLDVTALTHQDAWVPAGAVARLLEDSASRSGCSAFGLRLAEKRRLSSLGPLSMVLREEVTVRSALDLLRRYERSYNEALRTSRTERQGLVTIRVDLELGEESPARQAWELAVGATHGVLRELLGTAWTAVGTYLPHPAPDDRTVHERVLGPNVTFDHDFAGIVLYSADLDQRLPEADPQRRAYAEEFLRALGPRDASAVSRVRSTIEVLLPLGRCSADTVATELGVDRRTLHRHLGVEGETFSSVLDGVRTDLAERFLQTGRDSLTEISAMLGFGAPSGLSRWFRQRYGCSPSQWRSDAGRTWTRPP